MRIPKQAWKEEDMHELHDDDRNTLLPLSNQPHHPVSRFLGPAGVIRKAPAWTLRRAAALLRLPGARTHRPRSLIRRIFEISLSLLLILFIITPIFLPSYTHPPAHYLALEQACSSHQQGCANARDEKVFISVSLYDPTGDLASGPWGSAVESLIGILGPSNVFLSIYENDSGEQGEKALRALDERVQNLGASTGVVIEGKADYATFPYLLLPDGTRVLKRLAYQSHIRNRALEPLDRLSEDIMTFDKVLFLNDALFRPLDAAHLLFSTNLDQATGKTKYLSACALDFDNPFLLYDLYAQRDAEGYSNGVPLFPYFSTKSSSSRAAMRAQTDAVPVRSCWGGMVATQAKWIQNLSPQIPEDNWMEPGHHALDPEDPKRVSMPVRFRYETEIFVDACECCLFQADLQAVARKEGEDGEVFVNPYVRVAYTSSTLGWIPWVKRWERLFSLPQALITYFAGLPTTNPHREVEEGEWFTEEVWRWDDSRREVVAQDSVVKRGERYADPEWESKGYWESVRRRGRSGMFCLVREMQVIEGTSREGGMDMETNWADWQVPWWGQKLYFPT